MSEAAAEPGQVEAVAEANDYTLRLNGAEPRRFANPADLVRALTEPR